jgi:membrane protein required for colicin V production
MTPFDYAVLLIVGVSVLLSVLRGMVREILALLSWFVSFWVANVYAGRLVPLLPDSIPNVSLRYLAAFVALFLVAMLVMSLITIALSELTKTIGLGPLDRLLGAFFGLVRGLLVVTILVLLAGLTSLPRQGLWRNAMFSAPLEAVAVKVKPWLPDDFSKRINYE